MVFKIQQRTDVLDLSCWLGGSGHASESRKRADVVLHKLLVHVQSLRLLSCSIDSCRQHPQAHLSGCVPDNPNGVFPPVQNGVTDEPNPVKELTHALSDFCGSAGMGPRSNRNRVLAISFT